MILLVVVCFAHMVLFRVYNSFVGRGVMSSCKGEGGLLMRMVAWLEVGKSP